MKLGRIEYFEPLLPWFYLLIFISFHRPSLFLCPQKFWLVVEAFKCFVFEPGSDSDPNMTDIRRKFYNTTVENVTSSRVEQDFLSRARFERSYTGERASVHRRESHRQCPSYCVSERNKNDVSTHMQWLIPRLDDFQYSLLPPRVNAVLPMDCQDDLMRCVSTIMLYPSPYQHWLECRRSVLAH